MADPLAVVDELFAARAKVHAGSSDVKTKLLKEACKDSWGVKDVLNVDKLFHQDTLAQIPWLTRSSLRSGKLRYGMLVRYKAMVQDTFDPEYYDCVADGPCSGNEDGEKSNLRTLKFREFDPNLPARDDVDVNGLSERLPVFCIPVPGETAWARKARLATGPETPIIDAPIARTQRKRVALDGPPALDDDNDSEMDNADQNGNASATADLTSVKRAHVANDGEEMDTENDGTSKENEASTNIAMQLLASSSQDPDEMPCIIKLYDESMEGIKINQMVEVIGVLSHCPDTSVSVQEVAEDFMRLEIAARRPPSSLVPRIHCLAMKTGACLLHAPSMMTAPTDEELQAKLLQTRGVLRDRLTEAFQGDALVAEYALLWMMSSNMSCADPSAAKAIGKLVLSVAQVPENSDVANNLSKILHDVLPRTHHLRLNVEDLCKTTLFPKKDYTTNRLSNGQLQLCEGTPLILNETALEAGMLNDQGVRNMQALQLLTQEQKLHVDFQYFSCEWNVDTPVLIVTPNQSALVQGADCVLPLRSAPHQSKTQETSITSEDLRAYVAHVRQCVAGAQASFDVDADLATEIEKSYVEARQRDGKRVQAETLDLWLTLAKLWEKSHGRNALTKEGWSAVLQMEKDRLARTATFTVSTIPAAVRAK